MHYFTSSVVLLLCASYASTTIAESHFKWPTRQMESMDETRDAEILQAVQNSIREWEMKTKLHHRQKRAVKKVCYDELGCFEDSGPFSYLEMLPSTPDEISTKFYFYSTKNRSEGPLFELPFLNMTSAFSDFTNSSNETTGETTKTFSRSQFNLDGMQGFDELSTRVIVHGFGSACPHVWIYEMKTALMAVENCIVICVDWENGATLPNYVRAAANTRLVGKQLAMLLMNLKEHKGLDLSKTHIIGFSLGAHVAGFAGAELPGLSRITGLDPAGPLFESQHPKVRLDNTDANFVDVIHSNGENLILGGLGSWQPMGHVDFYPNGGRVQTGCSNLFVGAVTDFIWSQAAEVEGRSLCNHRRAYKFFIDSVAPRCIFPAFACDSYENFLQGKCFPCKMGDDDDITNSRCGNMGYYADRSTGRGQLYLVTREEEPFCAHQFLIEIHNSFNDLPLRTIGKLEATLEGEGGLNETFLITEKEDTEFFAGDIVSKIIVPHPALGFPTSLTLQYKSYSGWLSKGLPHWDIDKVVLTDSFGRSHSLCNPSLSLSSGTAVYMTLQEGLCEIPEQIDTTTMMTETPFDDPITLPGEDRLDEEDGVESVKHKKDIFNLGASYKIERNQSFDINDRNDDYPELSWQPFLEGNSLERDVSESSRSLQSGPPEIFEPVLKKEKPSINKGRKMHDFDKKEIVEPILKSTTPKARKVKQISPENHDDEKPKPREAEPITVQLFPFRLGELLERAERYARETLLPLISEQAPRFFGFGTDKKETERKPRYIPRYEEKAFNNTQRKAQEKLRNSKKTKEASTDLELSETKHYKNIFDLSRPPKTQQEHQQPQDNDEPRSFSGGVTYYSNKVGNSWKLDSDYDMDSPFSITKEIRIDLPTYRPPVTVKSLKSSKIEDSRTKTGE